MLLLSLSGYDMYTPNTNLIFHDYFKHMADAKLIDWNNHPPPQLNKAKEVAASAQRLKNLLKMPGASGQDLGPIYGLGVARTFDQFVKFSGVDPRNRKASNGTQCNMDNRKDWVPFDDSFTETHLGKNQRTSAMILSGMGLGMVVMVVYDCRFRTNSKQKPKYMV